MGFMSYTMSAIILLDIILFKPHIAAMANFVSCQVHLTAVSIKSFMIEHQMQYSICCSI